MIENNIAFLANYLWKQSIKNISDTLSDKQFDSFNMNDYYYLTEIYGLGRPKLGELAEKLKLTKPAISALTKRLEKNELIKKIQSEADKRVYYLELTDKGKKIIEGDNELYTRLSDMLTELLKNEEIEFVNNLLDRMVEMIDKRNYKE